MLIYYAENILLDTIYQNCLYMKYLRLEVNKELSFQVKRELIISFNFFPLFFSSLDGLEKWCSKFVVLFREYSEENKDTISLVCPLFGWAKNFSASIVKIILSIFIIENFFFFILV